MPAWYDVLLWNEEINPKHPLHLHANLNGLGSARRLLKLILISLSQLLHLNSIETVFQIKISVFQARQEISSLPGKINLLAPSMIKNTATLDI